MSDISFISHPLSNNNETKEYHENIKKKKKNHEILFPEVDALD